MSERGTPAPSRSSSRAGDSGHCRAIGRSGLRCPASCRACPGPSCLRPPRPALGRRPTRGPLPAWSIPSPLSARRYDVPTELPLGIGLEDLHEGPLLVGAAPPAVPEVLAGHEVLLHLALEGLGQPLG